jgi:hypothetical protein
MVIIWLFEFQASSRRIELGPAPLKYQKAFNFTRIW